MKKSRGQEKCEEVLFSMRGSFGPVVPIDPYEPGLVRMDFTDRNTGLSEDILRDIDLFCRYISGTIADRKGKMGIGGYGEHRNIYRVSEVFDAKGPGEEPRRLHLGTDIWAPAGTPVLCPFPGKVHSFSDQDRRGDYGAVIILEHEVDGSVFHTLYGHLSRASLNTKVGLELRKGECFGRFGVPSENGNWPPHLHFQVINDLGDRRGDYPGVCRYSEKEAWMANCPDPELILQLEQFTVS
jgi:murein DD-endopeptidase MepM/ murein hydrolase activator NlpD